MGSQEYSSSFQNAMTGFGQVNFKSVNNIIE